MSDDRLLIERGGLTPRGAIEVNASPLQHPGHDERVRSAQVVAGPGDRRLYLAAKLLRELLELAERSPTKRVLVPGVGLRVDLHRQRDGHQYEVWTFVSDEVPMPEPMPGVVASMLGGEPR